MKLSFSKSALITSVVFVFIFIVGCNSDEQKLKAYENDTVDELYLSEKIHQKDFYILYAWTTWCGPCINTIKEKLPTVQTYLDSVGVSVGLMTICADDRTSKSFFEYHDFMRESKIESYFLETGNFSLHDRWALNSYFSDFLDNYEDSDGVPIVLVVDKYGKVVMQDRWIIASKKKLKEVAKNLVEGSL